MTAAPRDVLLFTCEHAGNCVPAAYRSLFAPHHALLASHRGWDPGALPIARALAREFHAPLLFTTVTRLLVEPNRSPHHPSLFSFISKALSEYEKQRAIDLYYAPHRSAVAAAVRDQFVEGRRVVHIGVHTFTPELDGVIRRADIGLLYDPRRARERTFCSRWVETLQHLHPDLRVRRNYPYRGAADGLTTSLRRAFPANAYVGIELEVNQAIATSSDPGTRRSITRALADSLRRVP